MEMLKNTFKSMLCSILIASLSIPIVYAFDGLLGGGGLAQVSRDLQQMIPEKKQTDTALAEVKKQRNDEKSATPPQSIFDASEPTSTHTKFFAHMLYR